METWARALDLHWEQPPQQVWHSCRPEEQEEIQPCRPQKQEEIQPRRSEEQEEIYQPCCPEASLIPLLPISLVPSLPGPSPGPTLPGPTLPDPALRGRILGQEEVEVEVDVVYSDT